MASSADLTVVSAMITPAMLILASGSLVASALVRLARSMDHMRVLVGKIGDVANPSIQGEELRRSLTRYERRSLLGERAIALLFAAVATFVVDSLSIALDRFSDGALAWVPIGFTILGMFLLLAGAACMLQECRLGRDQIREEISGARARLETGR
jgi:hypothetical protein